MTEDKPATSDITTVLIVDDNPGNLGVLFENLEANQCRVLVALSGPQALTQLTRVQPDLILLDVLMPGMNGFETCRRIKERAQFLDTPVIFMSALTDPADKVRGFEAGAIDYITKPLDEREVLARVGAHVSLRQLRRELQESNQLLQAQREELLQRNRLLNGLSSMVAHDLRDRLLGILGYTDFLLVRMKQGHPVTEDDIREIREGGLMIHEIFESLLLLGGVSETRLNLVPIDTQRIVQRVVGELADHIAARGARIVQPESWPIAVGHEAWVERIWHNYLSNGLKYGGKPPVLTLGADALEDGAVRFYVRDQGAGIPESDRAAIFQPFRRLPNSGEPGHGLGLAIVAQIVERLGGQAGVVPADGGGAQFYFTLPKAIE